MYSYRCVFQEIHEANNDDEAGDHVLDGMIAEDNKVYDRVYNLFGKAMPKRVLREAR